MMGNINFSIKPSELELLPCFGIDNNQFYVIDFKRVLAFRCCADACVLNPGNQLLRKATSIKLTFDPSGEP